MVFGILMFLHFLVCIFLIIVVLLQSGKAADLAGAFGGMGSQTAFGPRGSATLLSKATTISAIVFMVTSLTLSIMATRGDRGGTSVLEKSPKSAPAQPGQQAGQQPAKSGTTTTTVPVPQPQPTVTLTDESTGATKTMPLNIPPPPGQGKPPAPAQTAPSQPQAPPPQQAPPKK